MPATATAERKITRLSDFFTDERTNAPPPDKPAAILPFDAPLPSSKESETLVLGSLLLGDADNANHIFATVKPEHFYLSANRILFAAMHAVHAHYNTLDITLITKELESNGALDKAGGHARLAELAQAVSSVSQAAGHARIIVEAARRRNLIATLEKSRSALADNSIAARADLLRLFSELGTALYDANKKSLSFKTADHYLEHEPPPINPIFDSVFDVGDKVAIISSSKAGKTFFILQMAIALSAGQDFLGWVNPDAKRRKVMLVQFEVTEAHYWRRIRSVSRFMHIDPPDADHLRIYCARGCDVTGTEFIPRIEADAIEYEADVIIFDPLYKLMTGGENAVEDMRPILSAFDRLAERAGVTVVYVHHDAKGSPGDRELTDRGSGSGVIGRDIDASIILTKHATEEKTTVVETVNRNYETVEPFCIEFASDDGLGFFRRDGVNAEKKTSMTASRPPSVKLSELLPAIRELIPNVPIPLSRFEHLIDENMKISRRNRKDAIRLLKDENELDIKQVGIGKRKGTVYLVGSPAAFDDMKSDSPAPDSEVSGFGKGE